ncbi:transcription factor divaricata [Phtheirospermum japonicum]|uniref:Transcription factor divaricata n=1 Tax=Phtheirospermum japonicum TaxID=374723 RepID=A0A830BJ76_9LAMI|nr:transcription factor divaricata [Phtheirospermum japonicum]
MYEITIPEIQIRRIMDSRPIGIGDPGNRDFEADNSRWTWQDDKQFENGLVEFPEDCPNRWERIAARLGTRSPAEVEQHYAVLLADVRAIEAGLIESPEYNDKNVCRSSEPQKCPKSEKKQASVPRKTGRPWTEDEHRLFLIGLEKYGKGDWKSISRYMVLTRNPTQVASHAQKHFERQEKEEQNKKRRSIFDNPIAETSSVTKLTN